MAGRALSGLGVLGGLLVLVLIAVPLRCGSQEGVEPPIGAPDDVAVVRPGQATTTLRALERAVAAGDPAAAERLVDHADAAARGWARALVENAVAAEVVDFSLRYIDDTGEVDAGGWRAAVEVGWRFADFDQTPSRAEVEFDFRAGPDRVTITAIGGAERPPPLWMSAEAVVRRTEQTLVLVAAEHPQDADRYTRLAERAVPTVRRVLRAWTPRLVVQVPRSSAALDAALGASTGEHARIAAITATPDGSLRADAPLHVFVNPTVFAGLGSEGAQVVMSHEATHVATLAATSAAPPWLVEGFADYVALRDVDLPLAATAGQIAARVAADGAPADLPGPEEFASGAEHLGAAYEAAWLACLELAEAGGEAALVELYRRVAGGGPARSVAQELPELFGLTRAQLVQRWQRRLEQLAGEGAE